MSSFSQVLIELSKILAAAVLGFLAKVLYDRRFAKRPDLRYKFQAPATFGAGEKKRIYQNLVVSNNGTERIEDVRVAFRRRDFESAECQVVFDGQHNIEIEDDRASVVIPSLPPNDVATISFVFSQASDQTRYAWDFFLSARGSNCLGQPGHARRDGVGEFPAPAIPWILILMGIALVLLFGTVFLHRSLSPAGGVTETIRGALTTTEIVSLVIQASEPAARGQQIPVEVFIENQAPHPFVGQVDVLVPWPGGGVVDEWINVGGGKRLSFQRKLKIPKDVVPGTYPLKGWVIGHAFDQRVVTYAVTPIAVK